MLNDKILKQLKIDVTVSVFDFFFFFLQCDVSFFLQCDVSVVTVLSNEPRQSQGRGLVNRKLVEAPPPKGIFIAGRPKAALLLWFFGDFRCGVPLFFVILVIYKYKNR